MDHNAGSLQFVDDLRILQRRHHFSGQGIDDLFNYAMNGDPRCNELYSWFLPLLRLDTVPKFVQLIKLVQERVGWGNTNVRPPRMPLAGAELEETLKLIDHALKNRP